MKSQTLIAHNFFVSVVTVLCARYTLPKPPLPMARMNSKSRTLSCERLNLVRIATFSFNYRQKICFSLRCNLMW